MIFIYLGLATGLVTLFVGLRWDDDSNNVKISGAVLSIIMLIILVLTGGLLSVASANHAANLEAFYNANTIVYHNFPESKCSYNYEDFDCISEGTARYNTGLSKHRVFQNSVLTWPFYVNVSDDLKYLYNGERAK